jgi:predicted RNA binding protein YcfA (HicA-like mRNA interferase family)
LKLPRDLSGDELTKLLRRFGYGVTRQTGSHIRVTSRFKGRDHHLTIPAHKELKIGTLAEILGEVAVYLEMTREVLAEELFGG